MGNSNRSIIRVFFLGIALFFVSLIANTAPAFAQAYKKGEEVAVLHLGEWRPGVVMASDSKGVMVEYEFASSTQNQVFPRNQVMYRFEVDAIYRVREWSDASGKFKIRAALLEMGDEKIRLRKPDLAELEIEVSKLSDADKAFLVDLQKRMQKNRIVLPVGPPEAFNESSGYFDVSAAASVRSSISPDPLPAFLKLKSGGVVFPRQHDSDRLGTLLALGGTDRYLLAAIVNDRDEAMISTRIVWASLEQKKVVGDHQLPAGEIVLDYHAPSHRLLTYWSDRRGGSENRSALTVWEVLPTDEKPKKVVRFFSAVTDRRGLQELWARFADKNTVIEKADRQGFVAWDLEKKEIRYRISQESFFAAMPVLSGGRKYLVMPEDKQVRIYDALEGKVVSTLPTGEHAAGVAVSEDGNRLAVLQTNSLAVWNLTSADEPPQVFQAEAIGTPFTSNLAWLDADHVMASTAFQNLVLFSLKSRITLWNYQFDFRTISEAWAHRVKDIVNGHLVYAAQVDDGGKTKMVVGAVALPGPMVYEKEASLNRDSLLLVKPGSAVRVVVSAGAESERIGKKLEQKLAANGWLIDGNAKTTVTASMTIGQPQTTTYRSGGFGAFGPGGREESVTITPHISSIKIEVDGQIAWQAATSTGPPMVMFLRENQTAQSEANKWNQPQPGFFEAVNIPKEILDPKYNRGLGTTDVTVRGLIPKAAD
jgi:hypothetical protein